MAFAALGFTMAAVFDTDQTRSKELALDHEAKACQSLRELLEEVGEEGVVVIATPHSDLAPSAIEAVGAGCHVLVEKPGGRTLQDVERLAELSANSGRVIKVGFNHRFHPGFTAMRAEVEARSLGGVLFVRATYGHGGRVGYEKEWRFSEKVSGGGELLDQGSHLIDLVRFMTGEDLQLRFSSLSSIYWGGEVEDNAILDLAGCQSGFEALLHASWTEWKNKFLFEVFCERGKLEVSGLGGSYGPEIFTIYDMGETVGPPLIHSTQFPPSDASWIQECRDFEKEVMGGTGVGASASDARAVFEIVERAYKK